MKGIRRNLEGGLLLQQPPSITPDRAVQARGGEKSKRRAGEVAHPGNRRPPFSFPETENHF